MVLSYFLPVFSRMPYDYVIDFRLEWSQIFNSDGVGISEFIMHHLQMIWVIFVKDQVSSTRDGSNFNSN